MAISGPSAEMLFIIWVTRGSLPGMTLAEYRIRSEGCSFSMWEASRAARDKAALSSACS